MEEMNEKKREVKSMYDITEAEYDSVVGHRLMKERARREQIERVVQYAKDINVDIWLSNPAEPVNVNGWKITVFVESVVIVLLLLFK